MLIPLTTARKLLASVPLRRPRVVRLPPEKAIGRLAGGLVRAGHALPERDLSAMDGYAVRLAVRSEAGPFRVRRSTFPGRPSDRPALRVGEAVYVATGAPLPPGSNAVLRIETTRESAGLVHLRHPARLGQDILRVGESMQRGDRLLEPGQPIRPVDIGALMALRAPTVPVFDLRAAVLPIGDELLHSRSRAPTGVPEYLGPIVAGLLGFCRVELSPPLPDDRGEVARALRRAARCHDLIVTIGGSSVGAKDVTKTTLTEAAGRLLFEGVTTNMLKRGGRRSDRPHSGRRPSRTDRLCRHCVPRTRLTRPLARGRPGVPCLRRGHPGCRGVRTPPDGHDAPLSRLGRSGGTAGMGSGPDDCPASGGWLRDPLART